ncbi:multiheme c-type cytochrome [Nannocystis pusilla]|uniref:multiheme c-type cytochrome n=1 Tax=Nannocystis pusilla TaxID=889268 RepID=UPI003B7954ED
MTVFSRRAWPTVSLALAALLSAPASAATEPGSLQNPLEKSADCRKCHAFANPPEHADVPNVSPIAWAGGMMANSARDPVFWAGVAIAAQDMPGETASCVRCHSPRAFVAGRDDATAIDDLDPDDLAGVDCDLCHRMIDDGVTPLGDAHYTIDDVIGEAGDVPKQGPWSYDGGDKPMHSWVVGDLLGRSEHCGTCHDVTTGATASTTKASLSAPSSTSSAPTASGSPAPTRSRAPSSSRARTATCRRSTTSPAAPSSTARASSTPPAVAATTSPGPTGGWWKS